LVVYIEHNYSLYLEVKMKKALVTLFVLAALAAVSSAREFPASVWNVTVTDRNGVDYIKKNPAGTVYCAGGKNYDVATGKLISSFVWDFGNANGVAYDVFGNTWVICAGKGVYCFGVKDTTLFTTANGLLSVADLQTIEYDKANNRLLVGAYQGLSIGQLDNAGKLVSSFQTAVGGVSFHTVGYYGKEIVAANTEYLYRFDGTSWIIYDPLNSTVKQPRGTFVAKNGNIYVGSGNTINGTYIAVFNHQLGTWSKIVPDSSITNPPGINPSIFPSVVVDNKSTLWFTSVKYLVSVDLNQPTPTFDKTLSDGSVYPWLNGGCSIGLGVTDNGDLLIAGHNAIVEAKSANAVRNQLIPVLNDRASYQTVREYDLSGRLITTYFKSPSFSFSKPASSMHIFVFQNAAGRIVRTEKATIVR
jgi:hypothetical protein